MGSKAIYSWMGSLCVVLLISCEVWAADPRLTYRTIETEHFHIHYHQGLEAVARQVATMAEDVHDDLSILFEWEVNGPTHVVITDITDRANGSAFTTRYPLVRLYATAPTSDSSLQHHDDWMRTLFVHEYTHIITMRIHSGFSRVVNAIFGDLYLPNVFTPRWYHEGVAVLLETYETSRGRIRSPYFKMTARAAIEAGTFPSFDVLSNSSRVFPRGFGHYIYGAMFMDYLRSRFGMDKVVELYHHQGASLVPYGLNRVFEDVFGDDMLTLYGQWASELEAEAERLRERQAAFGPTESTRMTRDGETKGRPIFSLDGSEILLPIASGMEEPAIFRLDASGGEREMVALASYDAYLSMDASGRVFYTRQAPFEIYYDFFDVFVLEDVDSDPKRVTRGARAWDAAVSPRGDLLAMTRTEAGLSALLLADERGNVLKTLVPGVPGNQVYSPAWSPDGKTVAVVRRVGPRVDIALIDVETGAETFVTDDPAIEDTPQFHPDGRYLFYESSPDGVDNIYARNLEAGETLQVTNVFTGASAPAISKDGKRLAFLKYYATGYDLNVMPLDLETLKKAPEVTYDEIPVRTIPPPSEAETVPYNPLNSLAPSYWKLNVTGNSDGGTQIQALTSLDDATGRHSIAGLVEYGVDESAFSGQVAYSYGGLGPRLHVGVSRYNNPRHTGYEVDGEQKNWVQEVTRGNVNLSFDVPEVDRNHRLTFGYSLIHAEPRAALETAEDPSEAMPTVPSQYFRAGLELGWSFANVVESPLGVSPHKGRRLSAKIALYHPHLGGTQNLVMFKYGYTEYIGMPWLEHHVLAFRMSGGVYVSSPPNQGTFHLGGYEEQNIVDVVWNNSPAGLPYLRGYELGSFEGDRFHSARLDYRFPIWFAELGYGTLPVFLKRVQGGVFTDNAIISSQKLRLTDWRSSVGAEVVWHLVFSYARGLNLRTGYAYGLMFGGVHEIIIAMGNSF